MLNKKLVLGLGCVALFSMVATSQVMAKQQNQDPKCDVFAKKLVEKLNAQDVKIITNKQADKNKPALVEYKLNAFIDSLKLEKPEVSKALTSHGCTFGPEHGRGRLKEIHCPCSK